MRPTLLLSLAAALLASSPSIAQEKGLKPKDKVEDEGKGDKKKECGVGRDDYKKQLKGAGKTDDDCEKESAEHFAKIHPDGRCHCKCTHGDEGKKHKPDEKCGGIDRDEFKKGLKKKGKGDDDCEKESVEHFKKVHPDGGRCHCTCDHESSGKPKGNNGVGNGVDPQPPGNPKPNDLPGTGPGNPGNKGGPNKGKEKSDKGAEKGGKS